MDESLQNKIEQFFTDFKHQLYKKGEILIRADDAPAGIFYLSKGEVKMYLISKNGDELVINIFKSPSFFPMSWAINQAPNIYFYEAMEDVEVWKAPAEEVVAFIKGNPDVMYNLLSRLYRGVDGVLTRMAYLMGGSAYARLITELIIYAKRFGKGKNAVSVQVSEKDLAAQSGMTRETVSREMKFLKEKGLVTYIQNTLTIVDLQKLKDELTEGV